MCTNTCSTARCSRGAHAQAALPHCNAQAKGRVRSTQHEQPHSTQQLELRGLVSRIFCRFISLLHELQPRGHTALRCSPRKVNSRYGNKAV